MEANRNFKNWYKMKTENYFLNCNSEQAVKIRFISLSKKYHPDVNKDLTATEIFQTISNQRDETLRNLYKKSGKSDIEIDRMMKDVFENLDLKNLGSLTDKLADKFSASQKGDKPPSFMDVFKMVVAELNVNKNKQKKLGR